MIKKVFKILLSHLVVLSLVPIDPSYSGESIDLQDLALPTEVKELGKNSGALYYSPSTKNKTLMPVHIWGEVGRPGLHFIPVDSKLIKGLSLAGGGSTQAKLDEITLSRVENGKLQRFKFDLEEGGDVHAHEYVLKPGDTIFVQKDSFNENRSYYTSLFGVVLTVLSSILLYRRIDQNQ